MVFRLKICLFSAYLSVVVVHGQSKLRKPHETYFSEFQTSTANRRSYMKPSLRVKIAIIFSSIQIPLTLWFFSQSSFHVHVLGAVHKVHYAIFDQFWHPSPVTLCHTSGDPKVRHTSRTPDLSNTKKPDKTPLLKISLNGSRGFCSGFFVWKVLFGVVFVRSPFCQNTFVRPTTER